jgi:ferredoxin
MSKLTLKERILIPTYDNIDELSPGEVEFDYDKCNACEICVEACPAGTIIMEDKKPKMKPPGENECIFCGDCMAICPKDAISMKTPYRCTLFFKTIDHGEVRPPRL